MNPNNTLFTGPANKDYLNHLKYPDAELKTWEDFTKAIGEKEFLQNKQKKVISLAKQAYDDVMTAHNDEILEVSAAVETINTKLSEFISNHESELKETPIRDLGEIIIEAETKIKYKIKHKKESQSNGK